MKCPTDGATLVMSDRSGVEIDYCPECRGVWLDRGELDKILERSVSAPAPAAAPAQPQYSAPPQYNSYPQNGYKKKPHNWLTEIFD
ncbi:zf-TFIIB domain-containing protein [Aurantimicrobium minutum]|uniref:TFIIB-type zinc ribbon-containing protein n=1 Tax=Aurantimicrobium minutum TaxID=708131 RepID=UPI00248E4762|nr:zf-TFIIB domain-containing protein [Aurantimicrobium minutum]